MNDVRPWYLEPETFIAVAALVVSCSAVGVGLYEAHLVGLDRKTLPPHFWEGVGRIAITVCYSSVFNDSWVVNDDHLGGTTTWQSVAACPSQVQGADF